MEESGLGIQPMEQYAKEWAEEVQPSKQCFEESTEEWPEEWTSEAQPLLGPVESETEPTGIKPESANSIENGIPSALPIPKCEQSYIPGGILKR